MLSNSAPPLSVPPSSAEHPSWKREAWLLAGIGALYLPLIFFGFGSDVDSYLVVETGSRILAGGEYVPSRPPGFPVYETVTGVLDRLGGAPATNLGTLVLALVAVAGFLALCRRLRVPYRLYLGITFALHPFVWANAATTMDYLWALGFGLWGGVLLLDRRWAWAGVLFGVAIGTRFTSALFVAAFFGYVLWRDRAAWRGLVLAGAVTFVLSVASYLPMLAYYGGSFDFLVPTGVEVQATWSWAERLGRFGYKNVYLWGLPATLWLAALAGHAVATRAWGRLQPGTPIALAIAVVVAYQALYLRYPLEQEYLLPTIPFVLIGAGLITTRRWLVGLLGLVLLYNVVSINLARPDRPNLASSVETGVWIEPGYLLTDAAQRLRVRGCRTEACWMERSDRGFFPGLFSAEE